MKRILVVMNHKLAYEQMKELEQFDFEYIYMEDTLKDEWENVGINLNVNDLCDRILAYAKEKECNYLLVMGFTPAVVYLVSKFGIENCYYSQTKEFGEQMKKLDGTIKEIPVTRHIGFYNYLTNRRIMPSEEL